MALTDVVGNVKVRGLASVGASPFHFFKSNPLLCGLYIFRLNLDMQGTGIILVSAWGSVMHPIHLYNACRQSRAYEQEWEDAEYIYQIHTQQRIFVGDPPAKPEDYLKRFVLALGGSAANFARNRRRELADSVQKLKKRPRGLKMTTPVKDIFQRRYTQGGQAVLSTSNMVAMLGIAARSVRPCKPSLDVKAFARIIVARPQLTPVQLLTCMREGMAAEEMHLLFDYLGLHQRGYALLCNLRLHLHQDLVRFCGSEEYVESASQLPYIVGYLFELLCASSLSTDQLQSPAHGSQALVKAAEVLQDFLEDGRQGKEGKMGAFKRTRTARWAEAMHMENVVLRGIWDPKKLATEERVGSKTTAGAAI